MEDHYRRADQPDIEAFINTRDATGAIATSGHVIANVNIVCPTATSRLLMARNQLACARAGQETKVARYRHLTVNASGRTVATSLPLVFETYGGAAPLTVKLLGILVASYATMPNPSMAPHAFSANLRARLSVTLQKGNAHVARMGLARARGQRWQSVRFTVDLRTRRSRTS